MGSSKLSESASPTAGGRDRLPEIGLAILTGVILLVMVALGRLVSTPPPPAPATLSVEAHSPAPTPAPTTTAPVAHP
jgi:hypothetical protein